MIKLENDWKDFLNLEAKKPYFIKLEKFLTNQYAFFKIYPKKENLLSALKLTNYKDVKVVIIGQDPYHQRFQANGLAFSVSDKVKLPPSLKNIFKEIEDEFNIKTFPSGNLERWARQGVLLLNTVLSVKESFPNSHKNKGWETFTKNIIKKVCKKNEPVVFMLWGGSAQKFESLITNENHLVLKSAHPSPLSSYRGFFGNNHFKLANQFLKNNFKTEIDWR